MARFACGSTDDALDLMQDAMFEFVRRYAGRPPAEWNALFYRILHSRITDWHRRTAVRRRILGWFGRAHDDDQEDPIEAAPDRYGLSPSDSVLRSERVQVLEKAIRALPLRQRQAFLLRAWEGMDVKQAAFAMGCSEGSIKTHYSRAVHTLRESLEDLVDERG